LAIYVGIVMLSAPDLPGHLMGGEIDDSVLPQLQLINNIALLPSLIVGAMITVGLQERALGRVQGPTFFYFSLGASVWRMVGALILLVLLLLLIFVLLACVAGAFIYASVHFIPHFGIAIGVIAGIAAFCWYIYAIVRFMFFLPAVVVAEGRIGIERAWELGRGNFWRIFAVMFVTIVPAVIAFYIVLGAVFAPAFMSLHLPQIHPNISADEMKEFYLSFARSILQQFGHAWPFVIVLGFIWTAIIRGLGNGAIAKAYLAVAEGGGM
jgi:hypothetical protein